MSNTIIQQKEADSSHYSTEASDSLAVIANKVNPDDVRRCLSWLIGPGETFEIRTFDSRTKGWAGTSAGYFRDVNAATEAIIEHVEDFEPGQCYVTLNPVNPVLYARVRDRIKTRQRHTTKDEDVVRYRNLLIDHDPVRPAGIPASEDELEASRQKMEAAKAFLGEAGFAAPLVGMSGNGYHLVYAIDMEVTDETKKLVRSFLEALAIRFDDARVGIDKSVHNPARISKLYGTFPRKGDDADDRVNRMSRIVEYPDRIEVSRDSLLAVIAEIEKNQPKLLAAAIEPCEDQHFEGVLLTVSSSALEVLRIKEGWPRRYEEICVEVVVSPSQQPVRAITYQVVRQHRLPFDAPVSCEYRKLILDGAEHAGLSSEYMTILRETLRTPCMRL